MIEVLEQRLNSHMVSDEAALSSIEKRLHSIGSVVDKMHNNHLQHMEPDMRIMKDSMLRLEQGFKDMMSELKKNSSDTNDLRVEIATLEGNLNTKIASLDGKSSSGLAKMEGVTLTWQHWAGLLIGLLISGIVGASINRLVGK